MNSLVPDVLLAIKGMSFEELSEVQKAVEIEIELKANIDDIGYHFDQIRDHLVRQFGTQEMDKVRTWRHLSPREKNLFVKAWFRAKAVLRKYGITDSVQQAFMIYTLVSKTPELKNATLSKIIHLTKNLQNIINQQFPNYSKEHMLLVMQLIKKL